MHSRRKGKSGSTKPQQYGAAYWTNTYDPEEIKGNIVEFKKSGISMSMIGTILRDQYGVPSVFKVCGKKISKILEENSVKSDIPEDLENLIKRAVNLRKHLDTNKKDLHNKRGLKLIESKIHRLSKYYKRVGKLPSDWKYEPEKLKLIV